MGRRNGGQKWPKMTFHEIEACNSIFDENFRSIIKISQVGCTNHILSKLVAEKCICRGRGVIHGGAKMRRKSPKIHGTDFPCSFSSGKELLWLGSYYEDE